MPSYMNKILIILLACLATIQLNAAHIIGGDVTYKCILIDSAQMETSYEITMSVYRDSRGGGAQFDDPARFGIFRGSGNNWLYLETRMINIEMTEDITFNDDPCVIIPPNIGVQKGTYTFRIVLPWSDQSYKIAYQRCCRNNTISNIVNPGETGAAFEVNILPEAQTSCNNSPTFDDFPPIVICAGVNLNIDQSATDAEGDQLLYEFCAPLQAGGTDGATTPGDPNSCTGVMPNPALYPNPPACPLPFNEVLFQLPTYSATNPMGAASGVAIDPVTGFISGKPELLGQYVVGVCVKEFRDGKLIGEIRRDFQFNVALCEIAVQAAIEPDGPNVSLGEVKGKEFEINSCGPTTVFMQNLSQDVANIDGYLWEMEIAGQKVTRSTKDATFDFPGVGTYEGLMIVNPGATTCSDTAVLSINIFPAIEGDFSFSYDTCIAGPVTFTDLSISGAGNILKWAWDYGDGNGNSVQNPEYRFPEPGEQDVTLIVQDENNCIDSISQIINWAPAPEIIVVEPSQFIGCKPASIFFNNLSTPINEDYDIVWTFGDGNTGTEISPTHIYEEEGIYDVLLEITSPLGCFASRLYPQLIEIKPKPIADFIYTPDMPSSFRKEVDFIDQSIDAISWSWNFGGIGAAFDPNPTFTFPDTGRYKVDLIVVHPQGCTDTMSRIIDVEPLVTLHMPNAFTPNNDGLNDSFKGKGETNGINDYTLKIWNRWGALIFETQDPNEGWNGEMNNDGTLVQQGVYVYTLTYKGPRGENKEQKGHITLIR